MGFLTGLHGTLALILICTLLFIDETGVPLPLAPNEGLLLLTGILIGAGALPIWLALPVVAIAMLAGMIAGYSWARAVGLGSLRAIAHRVGAGRAYFKVHRAIRGATPVGIAGFRMVPGLRPYATLVSGAVRVHPRTFLLGAIPALVIWEIVWIALGFLVGLPVEHLLGRFERLLVRGALLIALGGAVWVGMRRIPEGPHYGLIRVASPLRPPFAVLVDGAALACLAAGFFAIARRVLHTSGYGWIELVVIAVLVCLVPLIQRHNETPGEVLFGTRPIGRPSPSTPG